MSERISIDRVLTKLDEHLHRNDYDAAKRHLLYWKGEAELIGDSRALLPICNELMGLYRKLGQTDEALASVKDALSVIDALGLDGQTAAATTYLNAATVLQAAGRSEEGLPLFEKAKAIYEDTLSPRDERLGGLYNNMALTLTALSRFAEARALYEKAIAVMEKAKDGGPEIAITHLNIADTLEAEHGLLAGEAEITAHLEKAKALLEAHENKNGHYAFVCEKCAPVFGYFGYFRYEKELAARARRIYEGS